MQNKVISLKSLDTNFHETIACHVSRSHGKKKKKKPTFHSPSSWNTRFNSKRDDNGATITPTRVEERNYPSMSPTRERN